MTTAALIKSLKPGELVIRCADGSLVQTISSDFGVAHGRRPVSMRKLMRRLSVLKLDKKR
jgi:hypothetical protein